MGASFTFFVSVDEAIARYPAVVAHNLHTLGFTLRDQGKLDEAVAAYREAIRLEPNLVQAYSGLVLALKDQGKLDEAVAAYREAIRLKPDSALARFNLGGVLRAQGDYTGSLAMLRKGHELGSKQTGWRYPSAQWVADAERQAAMAPRLIVVLKGEDRPKDNAERLSLASMCQETNRFAAAARLTAEALESDPKLGDDFQAGHRHKAAGRAALAGVGQGVDDPRLNEAARNRFRTQARDWIRADLGLFTQKLDTGNAMYPFAIVQHLQHWKECPDLAVIRDAAALAKLPADEQKEWQALWARVAELELRANDLGERLRAESARVPLAESKTVVPTSKEESIASPNREALTIGDEAPAISVSKWLKGDPVDRLDPRKPYVVEFWATWCAPCRVSIPRLTELQKKYKGKGVTIIGVSVDQNQNAVAPFVTEMGEKMDYTIAIDDVPKGEKGSTRNMAASWMEAAGQHGIPTAFIVRDGKVAWIGHPMALDEALEKSLAKEFDIQVVARRYRQERVEMRAAQKSLESITTAAKQAWFGQEKEYSATCDLVLKLVKDTKDPAAAERAAKICSLRPSDDKTHDAALVLARRAVKLGEGNGLLPYFQMALGMAEYRSGHYEAANAALVAASELGKNNYYVSGSTAFYRAMSLFKQGREDEAHQLAAEAVAKMKPLPADEKNPLVGDANADDLILWMAYKEATGLLK
jgi:tetratricopeptide (TPR) repeat protein